MTKRIWSTSRQIMGNLLPALFSVPIGALGIWMYEPTKPFAPIPLSLIVAFPLVGILALNWLGLFGNDLLRGELSRLFSRENEIGDRRLIFAGISRPAYKGILDPHEEIAFLLIGPEELEIYGELTRLKIPRRHVIEVQRKRNIHSWLGLGGWVVLRFVEGAATRELFIEPREHTTLTGNRRFGIALFADLEKWRNGAEPEGSAP